MDLPLWILSDSSGKKNSQSPKTVQGKKINPEDSLSESEIVTIHSDKRVILASSPYAMKEIFFQSGCVNGEQVLRIIRSEIQGNGIDLWTGICTNGAFDQIEFKVFGFGNKAIYDSAKNFLKEKTSEAKNYFHVRKEMQATKTLEEILEFEPAYPYARLKLGTYYLHKNNCRKAIRNFRIFFRTSPNFQNKKSILDLIQLNCKTEMR